MDSELNTKTWTARLVENEASTGVSEIHMPPSTSVSQDEQQPTNTVGLKEGTDTSQEQSKHKSQSSKGCGTTGSQLLTCADTGEAKAPRKKKLFSLKRHCDQTDMLTELPQLPIDEL